MIRKEALLKATEVVKACPIELSDGPVTSADNSSTKKIRAFNSTGSVDNTTTLSEKMRQARVALDITSDQTPIERHFEMNVIRNSIMASLLTMQKGRNLSKFSDINNIYVCGMPGVGKSIAVEKVLKTMMVEQKDKILPTYCVIDISGTQVHTDTFYSVIAARLGIILSKQSLAREKVLARFRNEGNDKEAIPITILLIDEINNAPAKFIRELLEIIGQMKSVPTSSSTSSTATSISNSNLCACSLILIGISNKADFSETIGISYDASNHLKVIPFSPYEPVQLMTIIQRRGLGIFDFKSATFLAWRVARVEVGKTI